MSIRKKKIALVIGAGSVKCAAALGLWKVLEAEIISIFPEFERPIRLFDMDQIPYVIEQGEKAMLEQISYVKRLLEA